MRFRSKIAEWQLLPTGHTLHLVRGRGLSKLVTAAPDLEERPVEDGSSTCPSSSLPTLSPGNHQRSGSLPESRTLLAAASRPVSTRAASVSSPWTSFAEGGLRERRLAARAGDHELRGDDVRRSSEHAQPAGLLAELQYRWNGHCGPRWTPGEQRGFIADIRKAEQVLCWTPTIHPGRRGSDRTQHHAAVRTTFPSTRFRSHR